MKYGVCPECNTKPSIGWFKVLCNTCNIELYESKATRLAKAAVLIVCFSILVYLGSRGTPDILVANPENPTLPLLWYYIQVLAGVSVLQWSVKFSIRLFFTIYETKHT